MKQNKFDKRWCEIFDLYIAFKKEYERDPYFNETYKDINLGYWCQKQKTLYHAGKLRQDRLNQLIDAGFAFSTNEDNWMRKFEACKLYKETYGTNPKTETVFENLNIGDWLSAQRSLYKNKQLSKEREKLLFEAEFLSQKSIHQDKWFEMLNLYKEFKQQYNCEPKINDTYKKKALGSWCYSQRHAFRQDKLSKEREQLLRDAKFEFYYNRASWDDMYNALILFKNEYNRLPNHAEMINGLKIGTWISFQKYRYNVGLLTKEHEMKLRNMGIDLDCKKYEKWDDMYGAYVAFVNKYHRQPVSKDMYQGKKLGQWSNNQRHLYNVGKLSKKREQLLRKNGFEFWEIEDSHEL